MPGLPAQSVVHFAVGRRQVTMTDRNKQSVISWLQSAQIEYLLASEDAANDTVMLRSVLSIRVIPSPGNRAGGEQDELSIRVAHSRDGYRSAWRRLGKPPRPRPPSRPSTASTSSKNDSTRNPVLSGETGGPCGTAPSSTLSSKAPEWSSGMCASRRKTARRPVAGRVKQIWPVVLGLPVLQQVEAESVPVEAQAGLEVADHHDGMMNASGHRTGG